MDRLVDVSLRGLFLVGRLDGRMIWLVDGSACRELHSDIYLLGYACFWLSGSFPATVPIFPVCSKHLQSGEGVHQRLPQVLC